MTLIDSRAHEVIPELEAPAELSAFDVIKALPSSGLLTKGVYEDSLKGMADGVYISPEKVGPESANLPQILAMSFIEGEIQLGAGDSHHEVAFGDVVVERFNGEVEIIRTALKGFSTTSEAAGHEHDALLKVRDRGFDTFEPLALTKYGETTFLVTRHRDDIHTLDNEPWHISPNDTERYQAEVVPNLHFIATNMALLHSRGVFHGDFQAKNIAKSDTGHLIIIDLEDAQFANDPAQLVEFMTGNGDIEESKAYSDLTHCWYALIHPLNPESPNVFLVDEPVEVCMAEFEKNYLEPYFNTLEAVTHPALYSAFKVDELRNAVYDYIERTT